MRKINEAGLALIKEFEGLRLRTYRDSVGVLTIGYGHTGSDVRAGETITEPEAEELLRIDLNEAEAAVDEAVNVDLTDNQYAGLIALAFNIGGSAFTRSTLIRKLNAGDYDGAANQFLRWNKGGKPLRVIAGLTRRRKAERKLFLTDESELNGTTEPAPAAEPTVTETVITKTTETEKPKDGGIETTVKEAVTKIAANEQLKTIASEGVTKLAAKATTALTTGGTASATGGALTGKTWLIVLSIVLAVGAIGVVVVLMIHKSSKEKQAAMINSDRERADVKFAKA